ncbi:MAG: tyrosine-type recombinase/integrase [Verrucomicrobia bacterium]|nr:tyrosine-type recombinase/integrase [Verrucomicrobiota bacterium]
MTGNHDNGSAAAQQPVFHKVAENLYRLESSGGYYALVKKGGKQFRRSLKTKDRKLADRRLQELKTRIGGLTITEDANLAFDAVAKRWLATNQHSLAPRSCTRIETCIKNLAAFFKQTAVRNLTARDCEQWVVQRGSNTAAQTFAHELNVMKSTFNYAVRHGLILANPAVEIRRRRITPAKIEVPTRDQFKKLVAQIRFSDGRKESQEKAKDGADLVEFLAYSGARLGEAVAVRWRDVNFDSNMISIHGTKTESSDRLIPMTGALRLFLGRLKEEAQPKPEHPIVKIQSSKKCLQTACRRLGFPHFTHHDFRHFFATTCIESGVDIPTISRWLGHNDGGALAMKTYGHLRQEHSVAMIKRVSFDEVAPNNVVPLREEAVIGASS